MFDPEIASATRIPSNRSLNGPRIAASGAAHAGSTTSLASSKRSLIASRIASSSTRTTSSTNRSTSENPYGAAWGAPRLSAIVSTASIATGSPASRLCRIESAPRGSTPNTWQPGAICFTAAATPAMRPPPPTGTTTASSNGSCSQSSTPSVEVPRIVASPSNGWTKSLPSSRSISRTRAKPEAPSGVNSISAPYR